MSKRIENKKREWKKITEKREGEKIKRISKLNNQDRFTGDKKKSIIHKTGSINVYK